MYPSVSLSPFCCCTPHDWVLAGVVHRVRLPYAIPCSRPCLFQLQMMVATCGCAVRRPFPCISCCCTIFRRISCCCTVFRQHTPVWALVAQSSMLLRQTLEVLMDAHQLGSLMQCACSTCFGFKLGGDSLQQQLTCHAVQWQFNACNCVVTTQAAPVPLDANPWLC